MSAESEHLVRLGNVLAERGLPVKVVIAAVMAGGSTRTYMGFAALSPRVELMLPVRQDVLGVVAPGQSLPEPLPARGVIRASVDANHVTAGVTSIGPLSPLEAIDELVPGDVSQRWLEIVQPLCDAGGSIMNRTRFVTDDRALLSIAFPARTGADEQRFVRTIDEHLRRIDADAAHETWRALYQVSGPGRVLSVTTECTRRGPTAHFGVLNDNKTFDQAIDIVKVIAEPPRATLAAVDYGTLAGSLGMEQLLGVEMIVSGAKTDVVAWLPPRQA